MKKPTKHKKCTECGSKILFSKGMCRKCYYKDYNAKKKKKKKSKPLRSIVTSHTTPFGDAGSFGSNPDRDKKRRKKKQ